MVGGFQKRIISPGYRGDIIAHLKRAAADINKPFEDSNTGETAFSFLRNTNIKENMTKEEIQAFAQQHPLSCTAEIMRCLMGEMLDVDNQPHSNPREIDSAPSCRFPSG